MQERLLKRVRQWNNPDFLSLKQIEGQDFVESVRSDVEELLNTRQGTVLINLAMGLPDLTHLFNGFGIPEVEQLQQQIVQQINQFEPRLSQVVIQYIGDQSKVTQLLFQCQAQLLLEKQTIPFSVRLLLNENGSVSVMV